MVKSFVKSIKIMQLYYYLYFIMLLSASIVFVRFLVWKKDNMSVSLFAKALKDENNGQYAEAVILYESALDAVKKVRFHSTLKNKIIAKLKLLNAIIEFNNNFRRTPK